MFAKPTPKKTPKLILPQGIINQFYCWLTQLLGLLHGNASSSKGETKTPKSEFFVNFSNLLYNLGEKRKSTSNPTPKLTAAQGKIGTIFDWFASVLAIAGNTAVKKSKPKAKPHKFHGLSDKDKTAYSQIVSIDSGLYFRKHLKKRKQK